MKKHSLINKTMNGLIKHDEQELNKEWWEQNPMSYNWHKTLTSLEGTSEFFEQIDNRFFSASPFYRGDQPFERLIPFEDLRGKRVLEIGCGIGSHAQLISKVGCSLSVIDITNRAVELTRKRFSLNGIKADVKLMDAENMEFGNNEFDFVWSWGVIHHSANTERIIKEVFRVLKPSGEFRFMVYNRSSICAWISIVRGIISGKIFKGESTSEILNFYTDGYFARFYTRAELYNLLSSCGFLTEGIYVLGQKSELIPLPANQIGGRMKSGLLSKFPNWLAERILSKVGSFLFAIALKKPD